MSEKEINFETMSEKTKMKYMNRLLNNLDYIDKKIDNLQDRIDKAINILELSGQNKGICTRPETDTIQSALIILKGEGKEW